MYKHCGLADVIQDNIPLVRIFCLVKLTFPLSGLGYIFSAMHSTQTCLKTEWYEISTDRQ